LLDESSVYIDLKTKTNLCRDAKDNYLLSLAIDSDADFLITGDNDLLVLENVRKTRILKFTEFVNRLKL
jgi:putative PIN family toxin of toxin-antitoxin system